MDGFERCVEKLDEISRRIDALRPVTPAFVIFWLGVVPVAGFVFAILFVV